MSSRQAIAEIGLLLQLLDEGYERKTWHGPNLKQSLRGVSAKAAVWRPRRGRHNIWELAIHAAYWKYVVRRRLLGERKGSFVIEGSNWFGTPRTADEAAWRQAQQLLDDEHRKLRAVVADPRHSSGIKRRSQMVLGVAFHDIYHAGQIRLLRKLQNRA